MESIYYVLSIDPEGFGSGLGPAGPFTFAEAEQHRTLAESGWRDVIVKVVESDKD